MEQMMKIYDSSIGQKVDFIPIKDGEVSIYLCGPTVYDDAHLGHARSAIAFDLLRRTLMVLGFEVRFVRNYTDIDDKIIKKLQSTGKSLQELTGFYIKRYEEEMAALCILPPTATPKASEMIESMSALIERLLALGCAYKTSSGDIYFDTSKDMAYGTVSHKLQDEARMQSRIAHDIDKKNPRDFALWKACKPSEEVCFESSLGKGRPGWHTECSAMIETCFEGGESYLIDIHCGGIDLLFPHHENEAAQTRCATGKEIAKYWMHNGFVRIDGEKMSKSLGNSFLLRDALSYYSGEVLRFYLMSTHYRSDFDFNEVDLLASKKRLDKLYRLKKRIYGAKEGSVDQMFRDKLLEAMQDDLNISQALAVVDEMVSVANEALDSGTKNKALQSTIVADLAYVDRLLGVGGSDAYDYFQAGIDEETKAQIEALIEQRAEAKRQKDFEKADSIRKKLLEMGIMLMDTPSGTKWEKN